jgi:hypothetical protein
MQRADHPTGDEGDDGPLHQGLFPSRNHGGHLDHIPGSGNGLRGPHDVFGRVGKGRIELVDVHDFGGNILGDAGSEIKMDVLQSIDEVCKPGNIPKRSGPCRSSFQVEDRQCGSACAQIDLPVFKEQIILPIPAGHQECMGDDVEGLLHDGGRNSDDIPINPTPALSIDLDRLLQLHLDSDVFEDSQGSLMDPADLFLAQRLELAAHESSHSHPPPWVFRQGGAAETI